MLVGTSTAPSVATMTVLPIHITWCLQVHLRPQAVSDTFDRYVILRDKYDAQGLYVNCPTLCADLVRGVGGAGYMLPQGSLEEYQRTFARS